jgi:asparagine synthase (glutamine-hydrolysing)
MCGIAGAVGAGSQASEVMDMCNLLSHRGPDNQGVWVDEGHCVLGHTRLSIIDLSKDGNQPFVSENQRYVLVFNGEIYNYLELKAELGVANYRSHSDTEVLLHAFEKWGEAMLHKLNGMFAFAIWDKEKKSLFAARDRFGVKPFYYSSFKGKFLFSSEIPPFFKAGVPKAPNQSVWASYFANGSYNLGQETFWDSIFSLEPGFSLNFHDGALSVKKWYDFESIIFEKIRNPLSNPKEYLKELLLDATKLRFRADVPVGFNLSGGLDSSMLFSLINQQFGEDSKIEAFTFYTGDDRYDELVYVEGLMKNSNFKLNPVLLSAPEVPDLAKEIALNQAEPYGGLPTIAYSKLFKVARNKGFKVMLDGQGSDESWAGYDYYFKSSDFTIQGVKKTPFRPDVLNQDFLKLAKKNTLDQPFGDDHLLNLQYRDLFQTKLQRAIRFSDRVSMQASTELREPFLDYRLVEEVFSLPKHLKVQGDVSKWLFRDIASDFLNPDIQMAPKRPLQTPQREWLANELRPWVEDQVRTLGQSEWFYSKKLESELGKYFDGDQDSSFHVWQWINTSLVMYP